MRSKWENAYAYLVAIFYNASSSVGSSHCFHVAMDLSFTYFMNERERGGVGSGQPTICQTPAETWIWQKWTFKLRFPVINLKNELSYHQNHVKKNLFVISENKRARRLRWGGRKVEKFEVPRRAQSWFRTTIILFVVQFTPYVGTFQVVLQSFSFLRTVSHTALMRFSVCVLTIDQRLTALASQTS